MWTTTYPIRQENPSFTNSLGSSRQITETCREELQNLAQTIRTQASPNVRETRSFKAKVLSKEEARLLLPEGSRFSNDSSVPSSQQYTFSNCYAACHSGDLENVKKWILQDPSRLNEVNKDGETYFFAAIKGGQPLVLEWLLHQNPSSGGIRRSDSNSLLHVAVMQGCVDCTKVLLAAKVDLNALNDEDETPLDLAFRLAHDEIIHLFLDTTQRLVEDPPLPNDLGKRYEERLMKAKEENLLEEQILACEKLATVYLGKKEFVIAAKLLNCALALLKDKENPLFERYFLNQLRNVEILFLESKKIKSLSKDMVLIAELRAFLDGSRKRCKTLIQANKPIDEILKTLTEDYKHLLKMLIMSAQEIIGPPPVKWSCIGLGSMARGEMCPYSDIEFAFLIETESVEAKNYFLLLTQIVELKIINLGETKFPIFGHVDPGDPSPTCDGFCLDVGGNTPYGDRATYQLIGTPKKLASFQEKKWRDQSEIMPNAMATTCLVTGDKNLFALYNREKAEILDQKNPDSGKLNRQIFGHHLLMGHLREFFPNLSAEKEHLKAFGIKKELYRPFQEIISSLALFYKVEATNTIERISELVKMGVFCAEGGKNLREAVRQVLSLRLEAHFFYQDETEFLHHINKGSPQEDKMLYLDEQHLLRLHEIYKVLIPFCKSFRQTKNKKPLKSLVFCDESRLLDGMVHEKTFNFQEAQKAFQEAISLNPNDIDAIIGHGHIEGILGNPEIFLQRAQEALKITQSYGEINFDVAKSYTCVGMALEQLGKSEEALEYLKESLKIVLKIFGENSTEVAVCYQNIGVSLGQLGKTKEALGYFKKALKIYLAFSDESPLKAGRLYHNIGNCLYKMRKYEKALRTFFKAEEIFKSIGYLDPDLALIYNGLASCLSMVPLSEKEFSQQCALQSVVYNMNALNINKEFYGDGHPAVAFSYYNLGHSAIHFDQYGEALKCFQEALMINLRTYGENHPTVAADYKKMAFVLEKLERIDEALECYQTALAIDIKNYGEKHPNASQDYFSIGFILQKKGLEEEASIYFEKGRDTDEYKQFLSELEKIKSERKEAREGSTGSQKSMLN